MQLDPVSTQTLGDVIKQFEIFCEKKGAFENASHDPSLLVIDHGLGHAKVQKNILTQGGWVVAPHYATLHGYLEEGVQGALMKETAPAFTACFQRIVLCLLGLPTIEADLILKHWVSCLRPQGKLYFLMPGEMMLWEWATPDPFAFPHHMFLSRQALNSIDIGCAEASEFWVRLEAPSCETLLYWNQWCSKDLSFSNPSPHGGLTLHFVYGEMRKVEKSQDC